MHPNTPRTVTRRALLGGAGVGVLAALAGCSVFGGAPTTVTVTTAPPQQETDVPEVTATDPTVLLGLLFTTRLHVDHLTAAIAEDERDAPTFATLLDDRKQHLQSLEAEYVRIFGSPPADTSSSAVPSGSADTATTGAANPDEVLGMIRGDATDAQGKFTDALAAASPYQAELFGSIAACMATHRMVLS